MELDEEEEEDSKEAEGADQNNPLADPRGDEEAEVAQSDELVGDNTVGDAGDASELPPIFSPLVVPILV